MQSVKYQLSYVCTSGEKYYAPHDTGEDEVRSAPCVDEPPGHHPSASRPLFGRRRRREGDEIRRFDVCGYRSGGEIREVE